ncbi:MULTISPECIES: LLM class flavin-dependent oxidoreductase [unclassified Crossiella]|uniref:LLM class flavin-dependent oxidoreductase n=1 Tax=unclassified Crossiella TaxID=2620835 RepID=UPI001FFE41FD|nr:MULTISPECIES: LLM class flavin-dependent oxidoreductase [unclassified Crossiella]MCK2241738.1 LLM class flavin-dependent oxidoreductase [Crossiella sp. S99.2]MCK2255390.1 LLM class flavin-dependent oxidoreductase [Crossiella sp. S99.1]
MKTSIFVPVMPASPADLTPYAELVRDTAAHRLWQGQSLGLETHQGFAYLAGAGLTVPVGTSVTLTALRHPYEAALHARSLAALTGHSPVLGIGAGAPELVESLHGKPYPSPLTAIADYLTILRGLLAGEVVNHQGREYRMHGALPPLDHPPVELGLGVLRPAAARLAGELADAAITWMTPPDYLRTVLRPELEAGAAKAGRPVPRIVAVVHVAIRRYGRDPHLVALNAAREHLSAPHYIDMLRRAGLRVHPAQPGLSARALVDADVVLTGSAREIATGLQRYREAGVDEIVLNTAGVRMTEDRDAALRDLTDLLAQVITPESRQPAPVGHP